MESESTVHREPGFSVSDVQLRFIADGKDGLLAWASCVIDEAVFLNNIAIRRGKDGRLMLTFPAKVTAAGTRIYLHNPINAQAAAALEDAIIGVVRDLLGPGVAAGEGEKG
jgi:DNA-binding cell septation regulator SpoVG